MEITKSQSTRLIIGAIVLISGFLSPLLIPFVIDSGLSASMISILSGLLAFGIPELFMILAVAIMGKQGYQYLKNKATKLLTRVSPDRVSISRYRLGIVMFCIPIILGFLKPYLAHYIPFLEEVPLFATIGMDLMLLLSLFVLGGDFWEKLKGLFLYDVIAVKRNLNSA
ncbi:MAG: hypothetical protein ABF293_11645 [Flavobacteriaceae bacterium]